MMSLEEKIARNITRHLRFTESFFKDHLSHATWVRGGRTYSRIGMEKAIQRHLEKVSKKIIELVNNE